MQKPALHLSLKRLGVALLTAVVLLIIDQTTKGFFRVEFDTEGQGFTVIPHVLDFIYVKNTGAAFGLLEGQQIIFIVVALLVIAFALTWLAIDERINLVQAGAMGCMLAGALGNLIDRMLYQHVTDFIALKFIEFPVFNVADIAITVGWIVFFWIGAQVFFGVNDDAEVDESLAGVEGSLNSHNEVSTHEGQADER